jgi:hypothetical protein
MSFNDIAIGAGFSILMGLSAFSADTTIIDKVTKAYVAYESRNDVVYKSAYEGYGETCVQEAWSYPAKYSGIQDWKNQDPQNAKPRVFPLPNDAECEDNFNKEDPSVPITGNDYGNDYNVRAVEFLEGDIA